MLRHLVLICTAAMLALSISGCKSAKKMDETEIPGMTDDANSMGDSDSGKAMGLQTVRFALDSNVLDAEQKKILDSNADILKSNAKAKIQIEGHCDSRGGIQYNLALGERRAGAVQTYLRSKGIAAERMTTISYGKERLLDNGVTEDAHAKNRRANFAITAR